MAWRYITKDFIPCDLCGWYQNEECNIPDEIYEYECPNYNDPEPVHIPAEPD